MTLENLVCSLESAKRLKELGVPQKSLYYWQRGELTPTFNQHPPFTEYKWSLGADGEFSAFTASELGEMLPSSVDGLLSYAGLRLEKTDGNFWTVSYESFENVVLMEKSAGTLADAMAFMLIYLLENNLMKV